MNESLLADQIEEELLKRELARRNLLDFTLYTFPKFQVNWHHLLICEKLDAWVEGRITRLMIFTPPRHSKSELASRRLPAYILGKDPDTKIITASYSADLAGQNNRDVQRIIDSQEYQHVFPSTQLFGKNIRTLSQGTYLRNSEIFEIVNHKGVYLSAGIGGGIGGRGFTKGIIDDPIKNRQEAESKAYRDGIWDWYTSTFYTRRDSDNAGILIILTRWVEDDLPGRLLEQQRIGGEYADQWEVINLPAIAEEERIKGDSRQTGEALWPDKFSTEALKKIQANVGSYDWNSLYQQRPQPSGGGKIKRHWFKLVDKAPEGLYWNRFWDLAVSTKTSADYTASIAGALDDDGNLYLRDMIRGQWEWPDTHRALIQAAISEGIPVGVEEAGQQKGFIDELLRDRELQGISIEGIKPGADKLTRALPWISRAEAGKVFLVKGSWINEFLNECQSFTGHGDKRDDQIDGVSGVYQMCCGYVRPEIW